MIKKKYFLLAILLICINIVTITMVTDAAKNSLKAPVITLSNVASTGKIKVTWKKINGAKSYKVYRSADKGKTWKLLSTTKELSVTNTNAVAGKTYYYKVKAIAAKASLNSNYSKVKNLTCDLAQPVISVVTEKSTGKVKVSWKKINHAVQYEVYRSTNNGKTWTRIQKTKDTSIINENVSTGKTYDYKVKAIASKTAANSAFSTKKKIKCGYLANEKKTVKYTTDDWTTIYEFPYSSNTKSVILPYMTKVEIGKDARVASTGTWTRVYYKGKLYYVWSVKGKNRFTAKKRDFQYETKTQYQKEVVEMAVDIALNWKTVYAHQQSKGVKNPDGTYGFDCSGLVSYIHNKVMQKTVPAYWLTSNIPSLVEMDNIYNDELEGEFNATDVAINEVQPGDVLIMYDKSGKPYHCGIYLGEGEYAHASSYGGDDCVIITPMKEKYEAGEIIARRFLPEEVIPANASMKAVSGCKAYKEMNSDSQVAYSLSKKEEVTVLFTAHWKYLNRGNWAYVENANGVKGFVLLKNLEEVSIRGVNIQ